MLTLDMVDKIRGSEILKECPHMNFDVHANVGRIQKSDMEPDVIVAYTAAIKIQCHECGQPFEFTSGLPMGLSFYRPTVSISGQEINIPLVHSRD